MIARTDRRASTIAALPLAFAVLCAAPAAYAQASPQDQAIAQTLYDDARKAIADRQDYAAACPKLEESQRLDPASATLFHLADCYEHVGRNASAWAAYLDVASASKRAGRADREQVAREHAASLQPKVAKLTITVTAKVDGLVVRRDGGDVKEGQWGTAVPIDNGTHAIEASAPGKKTWKGSIAVAEDGKSFAIAVPALEDAPAEAAAPPPVAPLPAHATEPPPEAARSGRSQRTIALVVGGAGVVGLGVGGLFGLHAISKNSDSNAAGRCVGNACSQEGLKLRDDAVSAGNLSTLVFVVGGVLVAGGAALWFTAPSGQASASAAVGPGSYGGALKRTF